MCVEQGRQSSLEGHHLAQDLMDFIEGFHRNGCVCVPQYSSTDCRQWDFLQGVGMVVEENQALFPSRCPSIPLPNMLQMSGTTHPGFSDGLQPQRSAFTALAAHHVPGLQEAQLLSAAMAGSHYNVLPFFFPPFFFSKPHIKSLLIAGWRDLSRQACLFQRRAKTRQYMEMGIQRGRIENPSQGNTRSVSLCSLLAGTAV